MKIEIHSFESIQERSETPFEPNTTLISIGDTGNMPPSLKNRPDNILRLSFEDISAEDIFENFHVPDEAKESDEKLCEFLKKYNTVLFTDAMAKSIATFIKKNYEKTDVLICQCEYGQSRSAACAAAISEYYFGNGIEIFADFRYYPNKRVFKKVLSALKNPESI